MRLRQMADGKPCVAPTVPGSRDAGGSRGGKQRLISDSVCDSIIFQEHTVHARVYIASCDLTALSHGNQNPFTDEK